MNDSFSTLVARIQKLLSENKSPIEFFAVINEIQKEITDFLFKNLPELKDEVYPILKYSDVMNYFVEKKPNDPCIVGGAIVRESNQQGQLIMQVFLDKNNDLVCDPLGKAYGRRLVAKEFDTELKQTFGSKNLIIVK
jgi:hypothetical protein